MTVLVDAALDHFKSYIAAHCPKLQFREVYNEYMWIDFVGGGSAARIYVGPERFYLHKNTCMVTGRGEFAEVPISDPDSLEQVEKFLQEMNDKLP